MDSLITDLINCCSGIDSSKIAERKVCLLKMNLK